VPLVACADLVALAHRALKRWRVTAMSDSLAVKFVGRDTIEGLAIPYGGTFAGKDLLGEAFDANTDLCIEWFGKSGRPVLYDHGFDQAMKAKVIGRQDDYEERESGVWAQSQLDRNAKYRKAVDGLIEAEALGYSSGSMAHLASKNARTGIITRWPWVELSLTPIPAEPSTLGVYYVKSAQAALDLLEVEASEPLRAALAALDEWAASRPDDAPPAGTKFADDADRVLADVREFRERLADVASVRGKSGRVLSAATRERLAQHPGSLRELADDLETLLSEADAEKSVASIADLIVETARIEARLLGVPN
jgi:hypothetical protein